MMKKNLKDLMWLTIAFLVTLLVFIYKTVDFPVFSIIWLIVSILIGLNQPVHILGFEKETLRSTLKLSGLFLVISWILIGFTEYFTGSYGALIDLIQETGAKDMSFSWLRGSREMLNYLYFFLFTFFVSIFAEEAFFRGYLLKMLEDKYNKTIAIILQGILFSLPQIIVAFMLTPLEGISFVVLYSFVIYGVLSGYFAQRTGNIWPGLIVASVNNFLLTMWYLN